MTRQTNIGLLLALIFIVAFSLVLTEFRQPAQDIEKQASVNVEPSDYLQPTPRVTMERPIRHEVRRLVRPAVNRAVAVQAPRSASHREVAVTPAPTQNVTQAPAVSRGITPVAPITIAGTITDQSRTTSAGQPYRERTVDELERDITGTVSRTAAPARGQQQITAMDIRNAMDTSAAPQSREGRVYIVINGDNLRKISKKVYNSDSKWRKIYNANRNKLRNPNDIQIGMKLVIPEV